MLTLTPVQAQQLSEMFNGKVAHEVEVYYGIKGQRFIALNINGKDAVIRPDQPVYSVVLSVLGKLPTF